MLLSRTSPSPAPLGLEALRAASDEVLFEASRDGSELAFRTLVERHATLVRRLALNVVRNDQDAEDVAQEAFVSAWRNRHAWAPEARFTTWLYRIVVNKAIDRYRMRRDTPEAHEVITRMADAAVRPTEAPHQHASLERKEVSKSLVKALETLPLSQRTALRLFYFDDLDVAEIATTMVTSEQSVRSLLKRGRQTLRVRLQKQKNLRADGSPGISPSAGRVRR